MEQPLRSSMLKVPMLRFLSRLSQKMASSKKVYQLSLSAKAPTGSAIPEEGVKNLVHTKLELVIEPEEMDFERLERPNADLPKGEKRVVQEGQKGRKLRLVEVSQENGVETRKEVDAFVEVEPVAEITEVGTKEVPTGKSK